jgi:hypothetical protein
MAFIPSERALCVFVWVFRANAVLAFVFAFVGILVLLT